MKFKELIMGFFLGPDGKPSSKRVTAFWLTCLISIIVFSIIAIAWLAIFRSVVIKDDSYRVLDLLATFVLGALLSAVLAIIGIQGWMGTSIFKSTGKDKGGASDEQTDKP